MSEPGITRGHHLFLVPPDGALKESLEAVIAELSHTYGGPMFAPHLTIAAEVLESRADVEALVQELSAAAPPPIVFQGVRTGTSFFKCCYVQAELTPALSDLNRRAQERFSITNEFDPHISLAYGNYAPETLGEMAERTERLLDTVLVPTVFTRLELWETEGKPEDWKRVGQYSFAG